MFYLNLPYSLVQAARGGLHGKCAKAVGGGLYEGVTFLYIPLFLEGVA